MNQFNKGDLQDAITEAISRSMTTLRQSLQNEKLYGVSLFLDPLGSSVALICQTDEGLEREVVRSIANGEWRIETEEQMELLRLTTKWSVDGWKIFDGEFSEVNRILIASCQNPGQYFEMGGGRLVYLCCLTSLAMLDFGLFGRGKDRLDIVLNLQCGDQSDEQLINWAEQINPYEVKMRFAQELSDAYDAYHCLKGA